MEAKQGVPQDVVRSLHDSSQPRQVFAKLWASHGGAVLTGERRFTGRDLRSNPNIPSGRALTSPYDGAVSAYRSSKLTVIDITSNSIYVLGHGTQSVWQIFSRLFDQSEAQTQRMLAPKDCRNYSTLAIVCPSVGLKLIFHGVLFPEVLYLASSGKYPEEV